MQTALDATSASQAPRSSFGPRLGAYLIDVVIIMILGFVLGPIIGGMLGAAAGGAADASGSGVGAAAGGFMGMILGIVVALPVLTFIYYLIEGFTGITLGKLLLGIKVANADGTSAGIGALLTRYAVKSSGSLLAILAVVTSIGFLGTVGSICSLVMFVGCFFVLGGKKQSIHDMLSKTAVFSKKDIQ